MEISVDHANHAFLGIRLPKGEGTKVVDFEIIPIPYYLGMLIRLAGLFIAVCLFKMTNVETVVVSYRTSDGGSGK